MSRIAPDDIFISHPAIAVGSAPRLGRGILFDLDSWIAYYHQHLINSGKSKNTIASYRIVLDALTLYAKRYLSRLSGIDMILDHINGFLEWMEDYKISKEHGTIQERVDILLAFINSSKDGLLIENYRTRADAYLCELDDNAIDQAEFVLYDFYAHLGMNGLDEVSAKTIRHYVDNRPRVSNATMEQRRIAIIAFLKFIDSRAGAEIFGPHLSGIKVYPVAKHVHKSHASLPPDAETILDSYLFDIISDLSQKKRKLFWREYCALRVAVMIILMKKAGLRASEALTLRFDDIEDTKDKKVYRLNILGKGNKKGRVPIAADVLGPYLDLLSENRRGEYLSSGHTGNPMDRSNLYTSVATLMRKLGIEQKGLHLFRHTFGSNFATKNGNIKLLQQLLRHSNITTTMIYSSIGDDAMAEAVAELHHTTVRPD